MHFLKLIGSKIILSLILSLTFGVFYISSTYAHPGNTASDGGHYCWTNCASWGEVYGQRHFHGGYTTYDPGPSYAEQGAAEGEEHATDTNRDYIEERAREAGESDGYDDGYEGNPMGSMNFIGTICDEEVEFENPQPAEFYDAFQESYRDACDTLYRDVYTAAYDESHEIGKAKASEEKTQELETDEPVTAEADATGGGDGWILWALLGLLAIPFIKNYFTETKK